MAPGLGQAPALLQRRPAVGAGDHLAIRRESLAICDVTEQLRVLLRAGTSHLDVAADELKQIDHFCKTENLFCKTPSMCRQVVQSHVPSQILSQFAKSASDNCLGFSVGPESISFAETLVSFQAKQKQTAAKNSGMRIFSAGCFEDVPQHSRCPDPALLNYPNCRFPEVEHAPQQVVEEMLCTA
jgi:hypothetical protein